MLSNLNNQLYTLFKTKIMKTINHYVLNGAIALLSTAGLVACSSSDDVTDAPVNPTYDGKSVKTQFAINIATPSNGKTRMSAVDTQNNNNYLGMTNVRLLTLAATPTNDQALLSALALSDPSEVTTDHSSHIYSNVNIPLTTSNFLFYSTRKDLGTSMSDKAEKGAIVSALFDDTNLTVANTKDISFKSEPILSSTNTIITEQNAFASYLNKVVATQDDSGNTWSAISDDNSTLKQAYTNFIKTYTNAQRAGSAEAVRLQMQALYNIAKPIADNTSATDKALAQKLCENILNSSESASNSIKFTVDESNGTLAYASSVGVKISNFPCEQGLPEGAALLTWNGSSFVYNTTNPEIGSGDNKIEISNITYPLPIVYFDNTPAKANTAEISTWQTTTNAWDTESNWTGWTDAVSATTRSIALKNNINYGVAGLMTKVKCNAAALEDNRNTYIENSGNQAINVPTGGFKVTGILIGGQPNTVNWQFIDTDEDTRKYVVYDNVTNDVKANASAYSEAIYTLVFDNWKSGDTQEKVTFALELENGDVEFYGQEGVIAKGQKFYLIGQLDPTGKSITWPTYPETYTGASSTLPKSYKDRFPVKANTNRVFVQDFTTTANVNIKSLKNAYVTIPDLRATQLQLGLSVDLNWQTGLTFDVSIQ